MIDKVAIQALIDAYIVKTDNFITTNGVKAITGAQLNELLNEGSDILEQLKASYFNLIDEPRTALSTAYPPTTPANWNATIPTEVQAGLDQISARMRI